MLGNVCLKWAFALTLAGSASACFLGEISLEGLPCPCTDGYVCDANENVCKAALQTATTSIGGSGTGAGTTGGGATGGSGTGGGCGVGGSAPIAKPLKLAQDATALSVSVDGMFRIDADATSNWMLTSWYDLASSEPNTDLAGQGSSHRFVDRWAHDTNYNNSSDGSLFGITVQDESPARVTLTTTIDYQLPGLRLTQSWVFYANGKVAMSSVFSNTSASTITITDSEYHSTSVNDSLSCGNPQCWAASTLDTGSRSVGFSRINAPGAASTAQVVNFETGDPLEQDAEDTNRYWHETAFNLAANGGEVQQDGVLFVAPTGLPNSVMSARTEDMLSPGLVLGPGAALVGNGFAESKASYTLTATSATSVTFGVDAGVDGTRTRFAPTFVISDWTAPAWHIERGGETLVSSAALVGPASVAYLNTSTQKLVFVYEGNIEPTASDCERNFTLVAD